MPRLDPVPLPSQEYLLLCFHYKQDCGSLIWLTRPLEHFVDARVHAIWNTRYSGTIAGTPHPCGMILVRLNRRLYKSHRLIWKIVTGQDAPFTIDHENEIPSDNRWVNLRLATKSQNGANRGKQANNTSGYKGVAWDKSRQLWTAKICLVKINHNLGRFATPEQAYKAYCLAADRLHGEFKNYGGV